MYKLQFVSFLKTTSFWKKMLLQKLNMRHIVFSKNIFALFS